MIKSFAAIENDKIFDNDWMREVFLSDRACEYWLDRRLYLLCLLCEDNVFMSWTTQTTEYSVKNYDSLASALSRDNQLLNVNIDTLMLSRIWL